VLVGVRVGVRVGVVVGVGVGMIYIIINMTQPRIYSIYPSYSWIIAIDFL
jgi:hypothetical protein